MGYLMLSKVQVLTKMSRLVVVMNRFDRILVFLIKFENIYIKAFELSSERIFCEKNQ